MNTQQIKLILELAKTAFCNEVAKPPSKRLIDLTAAEDAIDTLEAQLDKG